MELRELSKLQIRAEVMAILQKINSVGEFTSVLQQEVFSALKSIEDKEAVIELLLKELSKSQNEKSEVIAFLLIELGNADILKDKLWDNIKNPLISDKVKDVSATILRALGEVVDPDLLLSYFKNPDELVDKETQKLIEVAAFNPEAQIDFLDFLFTLGEQEQLQLVNSLKEDFADGDLANLLIPALESKSNTELARIIIETLGSTRSYAAVEPLNDIICYSQDESLKKLAQKSLNMLKLSGVDVSKAQEFAARNEITKISKIYKCYTCQVDGIGNQGFLISRKKLNGDILMFSLVINDVEGIIDCFGFNAISTVDFTKVVERFESYSGKIEVEPEYCKFMIENAQKINKITNSPLSYEFISWKALLADVLYPQVNPFDNIKEQTSEQNDIIADELFEDNSFKTWFYDEEDNVHVKSMLMEVKSYIEGDNDDIDKSPQKFGEFSSTMIDKYAPAIFDIGQRSILAKRLLNAAYLFEKSGETRLYKVSSAMALKILNISEENICDLDFVQMMMKKSMVEFILRLKQKQVQQESSVPKIARPQGVVSIMGAKKSSNDQKLKLDNILDYIYANWSAV